MCRAAVIFVFYVKKIHVIPGKAGRLVYAYRDVLQYGASAGYRHIFVNIIRLGELR